MEFKNLHKMYQLYQTDPQFRCALQNDPGKALALWPFYAFDPSN